MSSELAIAEAGNGSTASTPAITVSQVSKIYHIYDRPQHRLWQSLVRRRRRFFREFHALSDITFSVTKRQTVGIIGRNGSGKSTLLQIICGTLTPSSGHVSTHGRVAALLELGAGFNPEFTGRENVYLNATILGLKPAEIDERYKRIVEFADIGDFVDQPVKTYSSGMVVRLAFAVVANIDADVLVIDEALAVGDAFFVQKCMRFLRSFMMRGTVLFVSHDTGAVVNLCERAIWLHEGRLMQDGPARVVVETYMQSIVEGAYGSSETFDRQRTESSSLGRVEDARPKANGSQNPPSMAAFYDVLGPSADARTFGMGGARIATVALLDSSDRPAPAVRGGEPVTVLIRCQISQELFSPIIGFQVKDRLGQVIFGENTFKYYAGRPQRVHPGETLEARFSFTMPFLGYGEYTVAVAIAEGTQEQHVQHHWIHDALVFQSITLDVATGLVGLPMLNVALHASGENP